MRNRKIPPFPLGLLDAFPVNVSAVDTGPRGSCATARRPPPRSVPSGTLRGAILGPVAGGAVAEALAPAAGGITGGYGLMWLVMIVPALGTLAIALGWSLRGRAQRR